MPCIYIDLQCNVDPFEQGFCSLVPVLREQKDMKAIKGKGRRCRLFLTILSVFSIKIQY